MADSTSASENRGNVLASKAGQSSSDSRSTSTARRSRSSRAEDTGTSRRRRPNPPGWTTKYLDLPLRWVDDQAVERAELLAGLGHHVEPAEVIGATFDVAGVDVSKTWVLSHGCLVRKQTRCHSQCLDSKPRAGTRAPAAAKSRLRAHPQTLSRCPAPQRRVPVQRESCRVPVWLYAEMRTARGCNIRCHEIG